MRQGLSEAMGVEHVERKRESQYQGICTERGVGKRTLTDRQESQQRTRFKQNKRTGFRKEGVVSSVRYQRSGGLRT